jgi:NADH-quinone oxidoreductase subunit F
VKYRPEHDPGPWSSVAGPIALGGGRHHAPLSPLYYGPSVTTPAIDSIPTPDLLARLAAAGLRGRGGGWFPTARKWHSVRVEGGEPVLIANGAEGEPGSFKDRFVMLRQSDDVVAGLGLAARAIGAREAIVFLKGSFAEAAAAIEAALGRARLDGLSVRVCRGDDSYIAGEETALLEWLEGRKPWPRPKPPLPAAVGLHGRPTLVQNVETLSRVPRAVADPEAYRCGETTLVTVWGDVRRPGVLEVPLGTPLAEVIERAGGASEAIGLVFPGGPAGAPLPVSALDTPLAPDALRSAGSALGSAAILVAGASACPLALAASALRFFERESCGQCPPCAVGAASLARVLARLEDGGARPRDLRDLHEVAGFMSGHGYCAHCRTAARMATATTTRLAAEVEDHVRSERCPSPQRRHPDPFAPGSGERTTLEAAVAEQLR